MKTLFTMLGAVAMFAVLAGSATPPPPMSGSATRPRRPARDRDSVRRVMLLPQASSGRSQVWMTAGTNPGFATSRSALTAQCLTARGTFEVPVRAPADLLGRREPGVEDRRRRDDLLPLDRLGARHGERDRVARSGHRGAEPALSSRSSSEPQRSVARARRRARRGAEIRHHARRARRLRSRRASRYVQVRGFAPRAPARRLAGRLEHGQPEVAVRVDGVARG